MIYLTTQHEQGIKNKHGKEDGAVGHFMSSWLTGPILARRYNLRYLYSHPIPEYMGTNWNKFLGFGKVEEIQRYATINLNRVGWPCRWDNQYFVDKLYSPTPSLREDDNYIIQTAPGQSLEIDWDYYLNNNLREKYDQARTKDPIESDLDPNILNVVCHIRRGDLDPITQSERWISNEEYGVLLNFLNKTLDNKCIIHICSDGKIEDFGNLSGIKNAAFHLDENPYVAFDRMVKADILINAKSAFSVCAAYLNKGIKLCIPFSIYWKQFPNEPKFVPINDNYIFNENKLKEALNDI